VSFVAGELGSWLVNLVAGAARKRLILWVLGSEQERELRQACGAAIVAVGRELHPGDSARADELAMVVDHVFGAPAPDMPRGATVLEALHGGIAGQLAVLDDATLTGTGKSSAEILEVPVGTLSEKLTERLMQEIMVRGAHGGPLTPLAAQLNHDVIRLQGQRLEGLVGQVADEVQQVLARLDTARDGVSSAALRAGPGLALPPTLEVRCSLPLDVAAFTGRDEELARVAAAGNVAGAGRAAVQVITGMPGAGKTALAVHVAHLLRHRFADRQLFLDLHGHTPGRDPVPANTALGWLLAAAGADPRRLPASLEDRVSLWRDRTASQRVLLVLDNAASSRQVIPLLPGGDGCQVLVTSRRHLGDLPGAVPLRLEVLPPDQAREMFVRLAPRAAAQAGEAVTELVRLAGLLPLALSLLARVYARHPSWTLADLTAETRTSMLTLAAEASTVSGAFDVSYRDLDPCCQQFLRLLVLHPGPEIDAYAAAALAGTGPEEAADHLDFLYGEGLLTEASRRRYGMHDLIRRYASGRAAADPATGRSQALEQLLDYYQYTAARAEMHLSQQPPASHAPAQATPPAAAPGLPDRATSLAWARKERASLLACLDHVTRTGQHARLTAFTAAMAGLLRYDGPWTDALTRHATAVRAARHLRDQPGQACALNNLGIMQRLTGDNPAAARTLRQALRIYRAIGDRPGQANTLHNLGDVQRLTGDYPAAARTYQQALGIYRDLGDQLGKANSLSSLAAIQQMTGDHSAAARTQEEALAIYASLGDQLLVPAAALNNLAAIRRLTGDYLGAARALEQALAIARDLGDRLGQAHALSNLGAVRRLTGDYTRAAQAQQQALTLYRDLGDRLGQANALNEIANLGWRTGNYPQAAQATGQALAIAAELGDQDLRANTLISLGITHRLTGDYANAAQALEETLTLYTRLGNRDGQAETLNELGTLHRLRGDLDQAQAHHQQARDLAAETASTWNMAHALAGLGRCALAADRTADAQASLRQAWEIYHRAGMAEAAQVATELNDFGGTNPSSPESR
jgi:tetratricopeptide (TPR) repeat protein